MRSTARLSSIDSLATRHLPPSCAKKGKLLAAASCEGEDGTIFDFRPGAPGLAAVLAPRWRKIRQTVDSGKITQAKFVILSAVEKSGFIIHNLRDGLAASPITIFDNPT